MLDLFITFGIRLLKLSWIPFALGELEINTPSTLFFNLIGQWCLFLLFRFIIYKYSASWTWANLLGYCHSLMLMLLIKKGVDPGGIILFVILILLMFFLMARFPGTSRWDATEFKKMIDGVKEKNEEEKRNKIDDE